MTGADVELLRRLVEWYGEVERGATLYVHRRVPGHPGAVHVMDDVYEPVELPIVGVEVGRLEALAAALEADPAPESFEATIERAHRAAVDDLVVRYRTRLEMMSPEEREAEAERDAAEMREILGGEEPPDGFDVLEDGEAV